MIEFRGTLRSDQVTPDTDDFRQAVEICGLYGMDPRMVRQIEVTDTRVMFVMDDEGGTVITYPQKP